LDTWSSALDEYVHVYALVGARVDAPE